MFEIEFEKIHHGIDSYSKIKQDRWDAIKLMIENERER